jgi:hypothetical protein
VKIRNIRNVAAQVMSKPDQEGLIVRNVINKDDAGARRIILLTSEVPPGKVHLLHLNEGDAVFITQGEWHGVRNDTDQPAVTLVVYAGAGTLEEAGYEEYPQQFDQA